MAGRATRRKAVEAPVAPQLPDGPFETLAAGTPIFRATGFNGWQRRERQRGRHFSPQREEAVVYMRKAFKTAEPGGPWFVRHEPDRDLRLLRLEPGADYDRLTGKGTRDAFLREVADRGYDAVIYGDVKDNGSGERWDHVIVAREGVLKPVFRETYAEVAAELGWEPREVAPEAPHVHWSERGTLVEALTEPMEARGLPIRLARRADIPAVAALVEASDPRGAERPGAVPADRLATEMVRRGQALVVEDGGGAVVGMFRVADRGRIDLGWSFAPGFGATLARPALEALVDRLADRSGIAMTVTLTGAAPETRALLEEVGFHPPMWIGSDRQMEYHPRSVGQWPTPAPTRRDGDAPRARGIPVGEVRVVDPEERVPPRRKAGARDYGAEPIEAGDLRLRQAGYEDVDAIWAIDDDPAMPEGAERPTRAKLAEMVAKGGSIVAEDADGTIVGSVMLADTSEGIGIGWQVRADRRGEGIGTAIVEAVLSRVFERGAKKVVCGRGDNPASTRITERMGFKVHKESHGASWLSLTPHAFGNRPARDSAPAPR